ncbi:MAG: cytochrome b [Rhodomicrobium sp.]
MAFGYLALALALAVSLNAANRFLRAGGTLIAALALSMLAVSIVAADFDGTFTAMPPASSPLDPFKPLILNIQAAMATAAAAFLFWCALFQLKRRTVEAAPLVNTASAFGLISRYAHWITATLILCLVPMGLFVSVLKAGSPESDEYLTAHQSLGLAIFAVAILRLLWLRVSPPPEPPFALKLWERRLARLVHIGLYVLIFAFPLSGFFMCAFSGKAMQFFGWSFPPLATADKHAAQIWIAAHDFVLPSAFYVLILAHAGGALKHHFLDGRASDIRRMLA